METERCLAMSSDQRGDQQNRTYVNTTTTKCKQGAFHEGVLYSSPSLMDSNLSWHSTPDPGCAGSSVIECSRHVSYPSSARRTHHTKM